MMNNLRTVYVLAKADFRKRFIGSYFGVFWMLVQPIINVIIYYVVFELGFKSNPVKEYSFVVWLLPGIIPWFFFNDAVQNGVGCVIAYKYLVKKISFDIELLPRIKIVSSLFLHLMFMAVLVLVLCFSKVYPSVWWLQCIYYLLANITFMASVIYFTSAINVFINDVAQFVNVLLQFGFWMAPIMYSPEIMPEWIQNILRGNPFTYIVNGYRDTFLFHRGFWEEPMECLRFWIAAVIMLAVGVRTYKKMKVHFADVL